VARVQAFYALQIPFYVLSALCGSLLASLGANREILRITAISFLLNAVFALVLVGVMGVAGIALATALAQLVAFCLFAITLRKTSVFAH
jgi:putative peptidoglycan lipid II flippase